MALNIFSAESLDIAIEQLRNDCARWNNGNPSSYVARIQNKQLDCLYQMRDNIWELQAEEDFNND